MRKFAIVSMFALLALSVAGCSKKTPEPETPATAQQAPPPAPTAPRPDPVGDSSAGTATTAAYLQGYPAQVLVWTDDGLRQIAPGTVLALSKGEKMILHIYPQEGALTFSGPLRLAQQGGHAVLELVPETARGTYDVRVRNGQLPEFPLKVEVR